MGNTAGLGTQNQVLRLGQNKRFMFEGSFCCCTTRGMLYYLWYIDCGEGEHMKLL